METHRAIFLSVILSAGLVSSTFAEPIAVWPDLAPGETTHKTGDPLPPRETDKPPITRVENITLPTLLPFPADPAKANGVGVLILPGGGFGKVVPDLEGSEAAEWLNTLGISAWVLNYRTTTGADHEIEQDPWLRPVQDSERALRLLRSRAKELSIDPEKVGLLGFSAGGQVASIHATSDKAHYEPVDAVDKVSQHPDFLILIYPWRIYVDGKDELMPQIVPSENTPPTFIVHTHDDRSSSLGATLFYLGLKKHNVPGELHVYETGGHGYGTRDRPNSVIGTWPDRAADWLRLHGLANQPTKPSPPGL